MFLSISKDVFKNRIFLRAGLVATLAITTLPLLVAESKTKTAAVAVEPSAPLLPPPPGTANIKYDFDGDGKADVGRWHGGNTEFKIVNAAGVPSIYTLGASYYKAAPGDFDGDSKTDAGVFYGGTWTYKTSPTATAVNISLGASGDVPVAGDYDNDGKTDFAVYTPSTNVWTVKESLSGNIVTTTFGQAGDIPIPGDFTGDGKTDFALFRPDSAATFQIKPNGGGSNFSFAWGFGSDVPVQGDFDGDGVSDIAIYRPVDGTWWIRSSFNGTTLPVDMWGNYGDQPVPANYDNDAKTDIAVWRPTTGEWLIKYSDPLNGTGYAILGVPGDQAVESAYTKQVGGSVSGSALAAARLMPRNATGGTDLYSQNFGWGTTLASLPGRSGMDASLGIGYNSLNWINVNGAMYFDPDSSNVSPGFRFGLPVIEPIYYSGFPKKSWSFIMVTPSGRRVEFRQSRGKAGNLYLSVDSSYTALTTAKFVTGPSDPVEDVTPVISTTDGTKMTFAWKTGAYRCTKITDRNGNVINATYDTAGHLTKLTDTLAREINVNYDTQTGHPTSIQQTWKDNNGSGTDMPPHNWATFSYTNQTVSTNFSIPSIGPPNGASIKTLERITYADGSSTRFLYNGYLQVKTVENWAADNHKLNYVTTDLSSVSGSQSDVPRFTQTQNQAENFNSGSPVTVTNSAPVTGTYNLPGSLTGTAAMIDVAVSGDPTPGLFSRTWVGSSGSLEGLPVATEDCISNCTGTNQKRWTWNAWTTDPTGWGFGLNPRITETRVGDGTNTKKTTIGYASGGVTTDGWYLPQTVTTYDAAGTGIMKQSVTTYNTSPNYTSRRMIALQSQVEVSGKNDVSGNIELVSKQTFSYDENGYIGSGQNVSPTQHDDTYYGSSFNYRGNLTKVTRHDVLNSSTIDVSRTIFNTAGSPISQIDALNRTVGISYTDNFNGGYTGAATYAYPTQITDPATYATTIQYRYDIGANVQAVSLNGKTTKREFDTVGRLEKQSLLAGSTLTAYTRYSRPDPDNGKESWTSSTLVDTPGSTAGPDTADEVLTETFFDGAGRAFQSRSPHTFDGSGNTVTYSGTKAEFDILGRVLKQYVPAEINSSWTLTGTDDTVWRYTSNEYDWKGRPLKSIPFDSTGTDGKESEYTYQGCGCAGGQVTTVKGPVTTAVDVAGTTQTTKRRTQKAHEDILGRVFKTEIYDLDGVGSPYSTVRSKFNGRDQAVETIEYAGAEGSGTSQFTTASFDGHGRIIGKHVPQQNSGANTLYNYNADDSIQKVTDGRGAETVYTYENTSGTPRRSLVTGISWNVPVGSGIGDPADVSFVYDSVGNRTSMTDGMGSVSYEYNSLSQMINETRSFSDTIANAPLPGNGFRLEYTYNLSGALKSLKDPYGQQTNYEQDKAGRLSGVTDSATFAGFSTYASNPGYRAWGGLKSLTYGNSFQMTQTFNNRLEPATYKVQGIDSAIINKVYEYYNDDSLRYVKDLADPRYDRLNIYDHVGRINEAKSGAEARGQTASLPLSGSLPYRQTYQYDEFNHLRVRNNLNWGRDTFQGRTFNLNYNIVNDRVIGAWPNEYQWTYDADGRNTGSGVPDIVTTSTYDASGKMIQIYESSPAVYTQRFYDGTGQELKSRAWLPSAPQNVKAKYFIHSTVLNGEIISESLGDGRKLKTTIYAAGVALARQIKEYDENEVLVAATVKFEHSDASGMTYKQSDVWSGISFTGELDPLGNNAGNGSQYDPAPPPEIDWPQLNRGIEAFMIVAGQHVTCNQDGMAISCARAMRNLGNGFAEQCPNNNCGPRQVRYNGRAVWATFRAFTDGFSGYVPNNAIYSGNGLFAPTAGRIKQLNGKVDGKALRSDTNFSALNQADNENYLKKVDVDSVLLDVVYSAPPCKVADFAGLSPAQQSLIGDEAGYNKLTDLQQSVFVNITGQLAKAGVSIGGLSLLNGNAGVENDRLKFTSGGRAGFQSSVTSASKAPLKTFKVSGVVEIIVEKALRNHVGMDDFLARQAVDLNSVQVGVGNAGAFGDIDLFKGLKHTLLEVGYNSGPPKRITPHYYLSYVLGNCRN